MADTGVMATGGQGDATTPTPPLARILVADDVPANVELLTDQLQLLGYQTIPAVDGPSAIRACTEELPDLCILDVSMPSGELGVDDRTTGFEICRRLKRNPRTARIPVIFVTALSDTSDRVRAIEAGGDDFLTKPHNRHVLGARVRSLLKLKAATDALEDSLRRQRELEKVRDDLTKMIVHDLKTPLTAVLASLEMVLDGDFGPLSDSQRNALGHAHAKSEDLLSLMEGLLEIARIEDSRLNLVLTRIEAGEFLRSLLDDWSLRLRQEEGTAVAEVAPDTPVFDADRGLLSRVMANLLQNAITHAGRPVNIRVLARRCEGGVRMSVQDDGPGIRPEYHDIVFRKFESLPSAESAARRGSGLGLTFCRLAVEAHGGRIWVESEGSNGSTFHVELPLHPRSLTPPTGLNRVGG